MAQSFGTLATAVILQKALDLVFTKRPLLSAISFDASSQECAFNQPIIAHTIGTPTVEDFGTGPKDQTDVDIPLTLNKFKEVHIALTPEEYSGTNRQLLNERAEAIALAIGAHLVDAVAALWTAANFANATTVSNSWDYDSVILPLRAALAGRGVPEGARFLAVNTTIYNSLLADSMIVAAMNNPSNSEAIKTGQLPVVGGFRIAEYTSLPDNSEHLAGFGGTKDSVVVATRVPRNPSELLHGAPFPGNIGIVKNPNGFSVMCNEWIDASSLKANVRMLFMYGIAKGVTNNGQRLITQAP